MTMTYGIGNQGPDLGKAHKCGRINMVSQKRFYMKGTQSGYENNNGTTKNWVKTKMNSYKNGLELVGNQLFLK